MDPTAPKFRFGTEPEYLPEVEKMNKRKEWCRLALRSCAESQQCDWCRINLRQRLPEEFEGERSL